MTRALLILLMLAVNACSASQLPDPEEAVAVYAAAIERGDADALYALLDRDSQRAVSREELVRILQSTRADLTARARLFRAADARSNTEARVAFADGRVGYLVAEEGQFRIQGLDLLPLGARTPEEALGRLGRALKSQSHVALAGVLTRQTKAQLEEHLSSLAGSLDHPGEVELEIDGDSAVATTRSGRRVELVQEDGFWKIRDFE
jgi:hypothetical protein